MILSDKKILEHIASGAIVIEPFDRACLGSNSYDVHLGDTLAEYDDEVLDAKLHNKIHYFKVSAEGKILVPAKFYLGVTHEYTETHRHVPFLEGKSSIGRLGIDIQHGGQRRRRVLQYMDAGNIRQAAGARLCRHAGRAIDLFRGQRRYNNPVQQEEIREVQHPEHQAGGNDDVEDFKKK